MPSPYKTVSSWLGTGSHALRLVSGAAPRLMPDGALRVFNDLRGEHGDQRFTGQPTQMEMKIPNGGIPPPFAIGFVLRNQVTDPGEAWFFFSTGKVADRLLTIDGEPGFTISAMDRGLFGQISVGPPQTIGIGYLNEDGTNDSIGGELNTDTAFNVIVFEAPLVGNPKIYINGALADTGIEAFSESIEYITISGVSGEINIIKTGDLRALACASLNDYSVAQLTDMLSAHLVDVYYDLHPTVTGVAFDDPVFVNPSIMALADGTVTSAVLGTGTLPTGVTVLSSGLLDGAPTEVGHFPGITVTGLLDGVPFTSNVFDLHVGVAPTVTYTPHDGTDGVPYEYEPVITSSVLGVTDAGMSDATVTAGPLFNGLTLSPTGTISGTPEESGSSEITIEGTVEGWPVTDTFTLIVNP